MIPGSFPWTKAGVIAALTALGDTPTLIAQRLFGGGWRGHLGHCTRCPVAAYLTEMFPGHEGEVGFREAMVWPVPGSRALPVTVSLPTPVVQFVAAFDAGQFRDLDESSEVPR